MKKAWKVHRQQGRSLRARYRYEQQKARWDKRLAQARIDAGLEATEQRLQDLRDERDELVGTVWGVPATDLSTLQVKARMAEHHTNILGSLAADVRAMRSTVALT